MSKLNIREFLNSIQVFFARQVRNIYKVMIVDALRSQGVNYEFNFVNEGETIKVNPISSENVLESNVYSSIKNILEQQIGKHDPNLFALACENLMLYLSEIYPRKLSESEYNFIAYCIHLYSVKMFSIDVDEKKLTRIYNIDTQDVDKILVKLATACSI